MKGVTFRPEMCHVTPCVTLGRAGHVVCHVSRHVSVTHPGNSVTYGVTLVNVTDTPTPKGCPCHVGRLEKAPRAHGWLALWFAPPHARTLCKDFLDFVRGGCGEIVGLSLTALTALIGMVA